MNGAAILNVLVGVSGLCVLVLGQRVPKWTSFGLGFGLGSWITHHFFNLATDPLHITVAVCCGLLMGGMVLTIRKLLPLVLGLAVGGYFFWALPISSWNQQFVGAPNDVVLVGSAVLLVIITFFATRMVSVLERISISFAGAVLLCAALGWMQNTEWVIGLTLGGLALDGLRRH